LKNQNLGFYKSRFPKAGPLSHQGLIVQEALPLWHIDIREKSRSELRSSALMLRLSSNLLMRNITVVQTQKTGV